MHHICFQDVMSKKKKSANLLSGKFDFLQIVRSVNIDLSNMASESQQRPEDKRGIKKE